MIWGIFFLVVVIIILLIVCFVLFNKNDFQEKKALRKKILNKNMLIREKELEIESNNKQIENTFKVMENRLMADDGVMNENIDSIVSDIKSSYRR